MKLNYFDSKHAIGVHRIIIAESGGLAGVKYQGLLKSVLEHLQNDDYYPDFLDKLAHLVYGINKNHSFNDGNKRASLALSSYFLELNGHDEYIRQYSLGMEEVVVCVASSFIEKPQLKNIIEFLLYEDISRINYFVSELRRYRPYIERESNSFPKHLLQKMIDCLISENMLYSDEIKFEILEYMNSIGDI